MWLYRVFVSDMVVDLSEPFSGCGNFNNQKIFWHLTAVTCCPPCSISPADVLHFPNNDGPLDLFSMHLEILMIIEVCRWICLFILSSKFVPLNHLSSEVNGCVLPCRNFQKIVSKSFARGVMLMAPFTRSSTCHICRSYYYHIHHFFVYETSCSCTLYLLIIHFSLSIVRWDVMLMHSSYSYHRACYFIIFFLAMRLPAHALFVFSTALTLSFVLWGVMLMHPLFIIHFFNLRQIPPNHIHHIPHKTLAHSWFLQHNFYKPSQLKLCLASMAYWQWNSWPLLRQHMRESHPWYVRAWHAAQIPFSAHLPSLPSLVRHAEWPSSCLLSSILFCYQQFVQYGLHTRSLAFLPEFRGIDDRVG